MTFEAAMEEVEIEAACRTMGISLHETDLVITTHQSLGNNLLKTVLAHGGDYFAYVLIKLDIIREVEGSHDG